MDIDKKTEKRLLDWNDEEPIFKQFEKKCSTLSKISGMQIDPYQYQSQYETHKIARETYKTLQTDLYRSIYEKYPEIEFGMAGRIKSPFSHYEKVIRKYIELFKRDEFKPVEILDDFAIKLFIFYHNYQIDKVSTDSEGIYIDSGPDEFRIELGDCFVFNYGEKQHIAIVKEEKVRQKTKSNVGISSDKIPYIITTTPDNIVHTFNLKDAKFYKKSTKQCLTTSCYDFQKDIESFFSDRQYTIKKRKDYISNPKPSGYTSIQSSFFSKKANLGIECQIRTYDMEKFSTKEHDEGYKPNAHRVSLNSLQRTPLFSFTTKFPDQSIVTYLMDEEESFEYLFKMSLEDYRGMMTPTLTPKEAISNPATSTPTQKETIKQDTGER